MCIGYKHLVFSVISIALLAKCSEDKTSDSGTTHIETEGGAGFDSATSSDTPGFVLDARVPQAFQDGASASGSGGENSSGGTSSDGQLTDSAENVDGGTASHYNCDNPHPSWLLCEDFEAGGGDFDAWLSASEFVGGVGDDDRGRVTLSSLYQRSGEYALYMPAAESSGFQGGSMDWRDCIGGQQTNCRMNSHKTLYFRVWVRLAEDHRYVHHFCTHVFA